MLSSDQNFVTSCSRGKGTEPPDLTIFCVTGTSYTLKIWLVIYSETDLNNSVKVSLKKERLQLNLHFHQHFLKHKRI